MQDLVLKNGKTYPLESGSNVACFRIPINSFGEADQIAAQITKENLSIIEVAGIEYHDVINESSYVYKTNDSFAVEFHNRESTEDQIINAIDNYTERLIEEGMI